MFDHLLQVLPQFLLACLVLAALPGPASVLCLHRTLRDGRAAGLAAVAGNETGGSGVLATAAGPLAWGWSPTGPAPCGVASLSASGSSAPLARSSSRSDWGSPLTGNSELGEPAGDGRSRPRRNARRPRRARSPG